MSIVKSSYLMWIGKQHYGTIEDWAGEAIAQGISKRLPNAYVAEAMMEPGTVVFVAHDEGNYTECPDCFGKIENPEGRKILVKIAALSKEHAALVNEIDELEADAEESGKDESKALAKLDKKADRRAVKIDSLCKEFNEMPEFIEGGTGGYVTVDGEQWDYRRYNYWLHQPKAWSPEDHKVEPLVCEGCGGTGRMPCGQVFGVFLPSGVEYILKPEDSAELAEKLEERGIKTVTMVAVADEPKRGCGKRRAGGYYATTSSETKATKSAKELVSDLVKSGAIEPDSTEIIGNFIRFLSPVDIEGTKRFRGIKRWSLDPDAEAEAEMILEAAS